MKILLLGEYSNVHTILADGLRQLGHDVTVASNGDFWKNYPRDIDLARNTSQRGSGLRLAGKLFCLLPRLRGYDIVQLINPMFVELRAERILPLYKYLRRHNSHIVLGAFGMDYYWVSTCSSASSPFKYSDFNIGSELRHNAEAELERADWLATAKQRLNQHIASTADAIVAGLYEYWKCYQPVFPDKTTYIPLPVNCSAADAHMPKIEGKIKAFIGIQRQRNAYKGTDIMLQVAEEVCRQHPDKLTLVKAENVPFGHYSQMMQGCNILLDQLYSYSPSMNTLLAMQNGLVCIGGGEEEPYHLLSERFLRPVVNVEPTADSVRRALLRLISNPEETLRRQQESMEFVRKHHGHITVARQYEKLYQRLMNEQQIGR